MIFHTAIVSDETFFYLKGRKGSLKQVLCRRRKRGKLNNIACREMSKEKHFKTFSDRFWVIYHLNDLPHRYGKLMFTGTIVVVEHVLAVYVI